MIEQIFGTGKRASRRRRIKHNIKPENLGRSSTTKKEKEIQVKEKDNQR
jgi:hypothetical protein